MNALYVYIVILALGLIAGRLWFCRSQGKRIVSGRPWAMLTCLSGVVSLVVFGMSLRAICLLYPIASVDARIHGPLMVLLVAVPIVVLLATVHVVFHARSLARSVILYNVRRDDLGPALIRALKRMQAPFTHRLGTMREVFDLDAGRVVVHGGARASRVEVVADRKLTAAIVETTLDELGAALQGRGEQILDCRHRGLALI